MREKKNQFNSLNRIYIFYRYRTVKPQMMCRRQALDEDIYCMERQRGSTCGDSGGGSISSSGGSNGRHFTITKTFHQPMVYDEVEKNVRLPAEADMIPADRIYEIRKEKIMIKADRNSSLSPVPHGNGHHTRCDHSTPANVCSPQTTLNHPHSSSMRSKSSDRYIDVPKSVRIVDDYRGSYDTDYDDNGSLSRNAGQQRLKSRSSYVLNSDYETTSKSYLENYVETSNSKMMSPGIAGLVDPPIMTSSLKRPSMNHQCHQSGGGGGNEIIYVPMVKEEFIKRESSKNMHCMDSQTMQQSSIVPPSPPGTGLIFNSGSHHNMHNISSGNRF